MRKNNDYTIIFIHIGKTGGTTFRSIINRQYNKNNIYKLYTKQYKEKLEQFKKLQPSQKNQIKLIEGHHPYGVHNYISNKCFYVTFLRNPIKRVISEYNYIQSSPQHYLYKEVSEIKFKDFIFNNKDKIQKMVSNLQTRILSSNFGAYNENILTEKDLNIAKKRIIDKFGVVGILDLFDESIVLLKKFFNWDNDTYYIRKNTSKNSVSYNLISSSLIEKIKKMNSLDYDLYQYAKNILMRKIDNYNNFNSVLEEFKDNNRNYFKKNIPRHLFNQGKEKIIKILNNLRSQS